MLTFDENRLLTSLQNLPPLLRGALAAAAASRLVDTYSRRHLLFGKGQPASLVAALQCIWKQLCSEVISQDDIHVHLGLVTRLAEREEPPPTTLDAYADKAAAAVVYALRALLSNDSRDVVTSLRSVYDATFQFAVRASGIRTIPPGSLQALRRHPVVQQELQRQQRDLEQLCTGSHPEIVRRLKQISTGEATIPHEDEASPIAPGRRAPEQE